MKRLREMVRGRRDAGILRRRTAQEDAWDDGSSRAAGGTGPTGGAPSSDDLVATLAASARDLDPAPDDAMVARSRAILLGAFAEASQAGRPRAKSLPHRSWVPVVAGASLLLVLVAVVGTGPGAPLYPVRITTEGLFLPAGVDARTLAQTDRLDARVRDALAARAAGDPDGTRASLEAYAAIARSVVGDPPVDAAVRRLATERVLAQVAALEILGPGDPAVAAALSAGRDLVDMLRGTTPGGTGPPWDVDPHGSPTDGAPSPDPLPTASASVPTGTPPGGGPSADPRRTPGAGSPGGTASPSSTPGRGVPSSAPAATPRPGSSPGGMPRPSARPQPTPRPSASPHGPAPTASADPSPSPGAPGPSGDPGPGTSPGGPRASATPAPTARPSTSPGAGPSASPKDPGASTPPHAPVPSSPAGDREAARSPR